MTKVTCAPEPLFQQSLAELQALVPLHYDEISLHKAHGFALMPEYQAYLAEERAGKCVSIAARADGKLVGYWIQFIAPGKHYLTCLTATMDIFFIHPNWRSGQAALRLLNAVEAENRRRGVACWFAGEKLSRPVGRLFSAIGMEPVEQIWCKWLGDK